MTEIARLLAANANYTPGNIDPGDPRPAGRLAIVTCMDVRVDVLGALGLRLGEAHVIRNAGGRVTDDVLRSLALSVHVLGVDTVVVMQHTDCGLEGVTDAELQSLTGTDLEFLPIDDHAAVLRNAVEVLTSQPYLAPVTTVAAFLYDVASGTVEEIVRWERPSSPP